MSHIIIDLEGNEEVTVEVYGRLEGKERRGRKLPIISVTREKANYYISLGYLPQWEGNYIDLEIRERRNG